MHDWSCVRDFPRLDFSAMSGDTPSHWPDCKRDLNGSFLIQNCQPKQTITIADHEIIIHRDEESILRVRIQHRGEEVRYFCCNILV